MNDPRATCYRCHRPQILCLCGSVTAVDNRTGVIILQHPKESRHPLGTVRLAQLGLRNVNVQIAWPTDQRSFHSSMTLPPDTGLLFPSEGAVELSAAAGPDQPRQLVILDGTWWQARRLFQDNPWLARLPHYRLSPSSPSQYRVRREPQAHCLSTIESIVWALKELEPDTPGLDGLLRSFVVMIDRHMERRPPGTSQVRHRRGRQCSSRAIPRVFTTDTDRLVLVYGEATQKRKRLVPTRAELLQWVAVRPATGEVFETFIQPSQPLDDRHLQHVELLGHDLDPTLTLPDFLAAWHSFLGADARLGAWNASASNLYRVATGERQESVCLKHAHCNLNGGPRGTLEMVAEREGLVPVDLPVHGRAARRLGHALALLRHLQDLAPRGAAPYQPSPPKPPRRRRTGS